MWFVYLSLVIQVGFGIHAVKTGRPFVWVLVIILFSVLGCLGYVIIELLPEWWASDKGLKFKTAIGKKIDPEKALKAAKKACEQVDTAKNRQNLAEQFMLLQRFEEAKAVYASSLSGIYAEDPDFLLGMAKAEFGLGQFESTISLLDKLKAVKPNYKSAEGHLLYARSLENLGNLAAACHEYEALISYDSSPEAIFRLAKLYQSQNKHDQAIALFESIIKRSSTSGKLFKDNNKEWVKLAKQEVGRK